MACNRSSRGQGDQEAKLGSLRLGWVEPRETVIVAAANEVPRFACGNVQGAIRACDTSLRRPNSPRKRRPENHRMALSE